MRLVEADRLVTSARFIIPVGFALVLIAILAVMIGLIRSREADMLVLHTLEVQQATQSVLIGVRDAENAKRSHLLSGAADYLVAFSRAMADLPAKIETLRRLTTDNREQQVRLADLRELVDAKIAELKLTFSLIQADRRDEALAVLNAPKSRQLSGDIRDKISTILDAERELLAERQQRAVETRYLLAGLIGLALILATVLAALLAISTRQALKGLVQRTRELEQESKLRHDAEETLRQAHKMEAVGQLTGGIAHDFNNILTIIIGNLDTMKRQLAGMADGASAALSKPLEAALQGARGAAQLTHRLLAFSRRQALEPTRLDLNRLVTGMLDMLKRTLGSRIEVEAVLGGGLWPTLADANQLENVLLNLALNAKDAMPNGGSLTIETANTYLDEAYARRFGDVASGQYVVLCVTDTDTGISPDVLDKVFEPFFTTKAAGEGSGLGLAMVHGFVKQSGGHVRIYSEEGHGTTVKIYLPRLLQADAVNAVPRAIRSETRRRSPVPRQARRSCSLRTMKVSASTPRASSRSSAIACWKPPTPNRRSALLPAGRASMCSLPTSCCPA